jgi:hypothetical protein
MAERGRLSESRNAVEAQLEAAATRAAVPKTHNTATAEYVGWAALITY